MRIGIQLSAPQAADSFAQVKLSVPDGGAPCQLSIESSKLHCLGVIPSEMVLDLLLLAHVVYALDRRVSRKSAHDSWTRRFSFVLPVSEPDLWNSAKVLVDDCLTFLTGDVWDITYASRRTLLLEPLQNNEAAEPIDARAVSLFSGGLDSLVGVIDYLESNAGESLLLVGHHDPRIGGPLSDQEAVLYHLQQYYPGRLAALLVAAGANYGEDTTLRSRSFLFIALGVYAASTASKDATVLIPENGNISLNVPLTPSRIGSCSTRTVHPYYLARMSKILTSLGIEAKVENPLVTKTKGECVAECLNSEILTAAATTTASCAKRGHTKTWLRRNAKQCGRCIPCIYRRAALHKIGLDDEVYGRDICAGEVSLSSDYRYADDFRACISFLRRNPSNEDIASLLLSNGRLDISHLHDYADIVARAMEEIRALLRDKAIDSVKRRAGLLST